MTTNSSFCLAGLSSMATARYRFRFLSQNVRCVPGPLWPSVPLAGGAGGGSALVPGFGRAPVSRLGRAAPPERTAPPDRAAPEPDQPLAGHAGPPPPPPAAAA